MFLYLLCVYVVLGREKEKIVVRMRPVFDHEGKGSCASLNKKLDIASLATTAVLHQWI